MKIYEKNITINLEDHETVLRSVVMLINFMYEQHTKPEYFRLRLKDSEKSPFSKDLLLEWGSVDRPERLSEMGSKE